MNRFKNTLKTNVQERMRVEKWMDLQALTSNVQEKKRVRKWMDS
jgi:hypothetical protein